MILVALAAPSRATREPGSDESVEVGVPLGGVGSFLEFEQAIGPLADLGQRSRSGSGYRPSRTLGRRLSATR